MVHELYGGGTCKYRGNTVGDTSCLMCSLDKLKLSTQKSHHFPLKPWQWTAPQTPRLSAVPSAYAVTPFTEFELLSSPSSHLSPAASALTFSLTVSSSTHGCSVTHGHGSPFIPGPLNLVLTGLLLSVSLCSRPSAILLSFVSAHITPYVKPPLPGKTPVTICHSFYILTTGLWCLPFCDLPTAFPSTWRALSSLSDEFLVSLQNAGQGFTF